MEVEWRLGWYLQESAHDVIALNIHNAPVSNSDWFQFFELLVILLSQPPTCGDYRHVPLCLVIPVSASGSDVAVVSHKMSPLGETR